MEESIALARKRGAYLALNLLLFPGISDSLDEVSALERLIVRYRVDQIQTRSLCIDPLQYLEVAHRAQASSEGIGVEQMLSRLRSAAPWLRVGNFAMAADERKKDAASSLGSSSARIERWPQ